MPNNGRGNWTPEGSFMHPTNKRELKDGLKDMHPKVCVEDSE